MSSLLEHQIFLPLSLEESSGLSLFSEVNCKTSRICRYQRFVKWKFGPLALSGQKNKKKKKQNKNKTPPKKTTKQTNKQQQQQKNNPNTFSLIVFDLFIFIVAIHMPLIWEH